MNKTRTSNEVLQLFLDHLNIVEQSRQMILNEYFKEETVESKKLQGFFREYIITLKSYVKNAKLVTKDNKIHPVVIIGSIVEVEDMEDNEIFKYHIVLPFSTSHEPSYDCASCLSPLGKALLFKKIDDEIDIEIPTGKLHYYIKSITLPDSFEASSFFK